MFDWSFYTFQAIPYVIDVYRGDGEAQKNPLNVALSCKSITVVDPRFYPDGENQDMVGLALDRQYYDAAMYLHGTFYTTKYSMFGKWNLDEESENK